MIVVVGSVNMDLIARVPRLPLPGETILGTSLQQTPGGKGANQAVAAARAGGSVAFVGCVGNDTAGTHLVERLSEEGVNTSFVARDWERPTGTALIAVDEFGENDIIVIPGANSGLSSEVLERAASLFEESDLVLVQLEIPLDTVHRAATLAREAGARIVLNPSPAQALDPSLLRLVDIVVPNEEEVAYLSGMGSPVDPASAAGMLCANGAKSVVVTLGSGGSTVVGDGTETDVPAFEVDAVDTTGAGDAFVGNLAVALDEGRSLEDAVRFASAAAALSVQRTGAQPSMPTRAETESFLRETPS